MKPFSSVFYTFFPFFILLAWASPMFAAEKIGRDLSPAAHLAVAEAGNFLSNGESEKAISVLNQFEAKNPDKKYALVSFYLGNAWLQAKNPAKALPHYREAAKLAPDSADILHNYAIAAYDTNAYAEAARAMAMAYEHQSPQQPETLYYCGVFHMTAEDNPAAWAALKKLLAAEKNPREEWIQAYIHVAMAVKKENEALRVLERFLDKNPENEKFWEMAMHLYLRTNAYKKAVAALEIQMQLRPPKASDYRLLGDLYANLHLPLPASRAYAGARALGDGKPDLFLKEAQMLQAAMLYEKALEKVREGAKHGASPSIWQIAMHIYLAENRYGEAFDAGCRYEKSRDKTDSSLLLSLGFCAYKAGKMEEALSFLHRIPEKDKKAHEDASRLISFLMAEMAEKERNES